MATEGQGVALPAEDLANTISVPVKREILWRRVVRYLEAGRSTAEIASAVGHSEYTIRKWFNDPRFIIYARQFDELICERLDAELGTLKERIDHAAPHAFDALQEILATTQDQRVKASVAQDMLDRAGHGPVKRSVHAEVIFNVSPEGARALRDTFVESVKVEKAKDITPPSAPSSAPPPAGAEVKPKPNGEESV